MKVTVGDRIQWECCGQWMFDPLARVVDVSECGQYVFVEGTKTGIPVIEITEVRRNGKRLISPW